MKINTSTSIDLFLARVQSHASERGTTRGTLERLESFYERVC